MKIHNTAGNINGIFCVRPKFPSRKINGIPVSGVRRKKSGGKLETQSYAFQSYYILTKAPHFKVKRLDHPICPKL